MGPAFCSEEGKASRAHATVKLHEACFFTDRSAVALTNADFRKLLMTPRVDAPAVAPPSANKEKIGGSSHSKASQQASTRYTETVGW